MLALIPVFLSIGAIYALIPVIVIVILIAAAAGFRGVDSIFGVFGFAALASFVGGKGAIGGGKAGRGIFGARYKSDTKTLKGVAAKMGQTARDERLKKQHGTFGKDISATEKSKGYSTAKTDSMIKQQVPGGAMQKTTVDVAKSWNKIGMQTNPTKTMMAVNREVQARYKRGIRGEKLIQKNLPITDRIIGRASRIGYAGQNTISAFGITAGAGAAVENAIYGSMTPHNVEMLKRKNEIYEEANRNLSKVATGAWYNVASTTDNWSERIIGKRIIASVIPPASKPGSGAPIGAAPPPGIGAAGTPSAEPAWKTYLASWKTAYAHKGITSWSY
ncbi:MAG: hypothetical protein KGH60_00620 [Candidatus Micrarchaeota archaeon]|nr:hypothetical protein [Candidatus Micrarchaeota archaeon]